MKRRAILIPVIAAMCGPLFTGCQQALPAKDALTTLIDVSDPDEERLLAYCQLAYDAQRRYPAGTSLTVFAFGHTAEPLYRGTVMRDRSQFGRAILLPLKERQGLIAERGTRTDLAFAVLASEIGRQGSPIDVLVLTDGGMEDQGQEAMGRLSRSVKELGRSACLRSLHMVGVKQCYRLTWEEWLRPLGSRASVHGLTDAGSASQVGGSR